jgi:hypothetical protein
MPDRQDRCKCASIFCAVLRRTAILHGFDLIEHEAEDLRNLPFLDRKAELARLLRDTEAGILLNEHIAENGPTVFPVCLRARCRGVSCRRRSMARIGLVRAASGSRSATQQASPCSGSAARIGIGDPGTRSTEVTPKPNLARKSYP